MFTSDTHDCFYEWISRQTILEIVNAFSGWSKAVVETRDHAVLLSDVHIGGVRNSSGKEEGILTVKPRSSLIMEKGNSAVFIKNSPYGHKCSLDIFR